MYYNDEYKYFISAVIIDIFNEPGVYNILLKSGSCIQVQGPIQPDLYIANETPMLSILKIKDLAGNTHNIFIHQIEDILVKNLNPKSYNQYQSQDHDKSYTHYQAPPQTEPYKCQSCRNLHSTLCGNCHEGSRYIQLSTPRPKQKNK